MAALNLKRIIDNFDPDIEALASKLYPKNKYPKAALLNAIEGNTQLNATQVYDLSVFLGIDVNTLYKFNDAQWQQAGILTYTKGAFKAIINPRNNTVTVIKTEPRSHVVAYETFILHEYGFKLSTLEKLLNSIIKELC